MNSNMNIAILICTFLLLMETVFCHLGEEPVHRHTRQAGAGTTTGTNLNENDAIMFLQEYNTRAQVEFNEYMEAYWAYESDLTEENQQRNVSTLIY